VCQRTNKSQDSFSTIFLAPDAQNLPYEPLEEFEKLRQNPPFPIDFNDETDNEISRDKRDTEKSLLSSLFSNKKKRKNKMDEKIRDIPESPENSKFQGMNL
jgi:hypothetical protein